MRFLTKSFLIAGMALAVAGCSSSSSTPSSGSKLSNLFFFNKTEAPEVAKPSTEAAYCPAVDVFEGGAHAQSARRQFTLTDFARECELRPDGSVLVKVGVEGRVLLSAGNGGRYTAPLRFRIVAPDNSVLMQKSQTASVALGGGETSGSFALVQEGLVVPAAYAENFDIQVGLGGR